MVFCAFADDDEVSSELPRNIDHERRRHRVTTEGRPYDLFKLMGVGYRKTVGSNVITCAALCPLHGIRERFPLSASNRNALSAEEPRYVPQAIAGLDSHLFQLAPADCIWEASHKLQSQLRPNAEASHRPNFLETWFSASGSV